MSEELRSARVGIVGCGNVTELYLPGCARFPIIELAACADVDPARVDALAARGGFPAMAIDDLIADPTIEVVLNLTPPIAHAEVTRRAIAAGKHVYSEKPLATTRDDAADLLAMADAAGVRLGSAPDTFLGGGLQTARALVDEGAIGIPLVASATVAHLGPERWHPNPGIFYAVGAGPVLDVAVYDVAALVSLLGPVRRVAAAGRGIGGERRMATGPLAGTTFASATPTTVVGVLEFASGVVASLTASFDVIASAAPHLEVHGTAGSLRMGDPETFAGPVALHALGAAGWADVPFRRDATVGRGIGLADLIAGLRSGTAHRASAGFAYHVLDVLLALEAAIATDDWLTIDSTTERPAPLA